MLWFVIPIRHPSTVADAEIQYRALSQTVASLARQPADLCRILIAAEGDTRLPPLPATATVVRTTIAPDHGLRGARDLPAYFAAVRRDKGSRIAAALRQVDRDGLLARTDYTMVVDDDDLVHEGRSAFVASQPPGQGWAITQGYGWDVTDRRVEPLDAFHKTCGTSLIVRAGAYLFFQDDRARASMDSVEELGSHTRIVRRLTQAGTPLGHVPFRAAVYRRGHVTATQRQIAVAGLGRPGAAGPGWMGRARASVTAVLDRIRRRPAPATARTRDQQAHPGGAPPADEALLHDSFGLPRDPQT